TTDIIRVILQTQDSQLLRLPWHAWDLLEHYSHSEIAFASPNYERSNPLPRTNSKINILAIIGDSRGINTQSDRAILEQNLPDSNITFLVEPRRQELNDYLWEKNWDILFFAGHSLTNSDETGRIYLNQIDSLSMVELRYALQKAVANGLHLAIFNSCDGLGLARELSSLQIPEIVFMREPVADRIASEFLKYFLNEFATGTEFFIAVRRARERLQGLEDKFPCATWLPMICQNNPIQKPLTWSQLYFNKNQTDIQNIQKLQPLFNIIDSTNTFKKVKKNQLGLPFNYLFRFQGKLRLGLINSILVVLIILSLRYFGLLESVELQTFDQMVWLRSFVVQEQPDHRIVMVTIDDEDLAQQRHKGESLKGTSISDKSLNILLENLQQYQPSVIGLDVYRDFQSEDPQLTTRLKETRNLIVICKGSDHTVKSRGIAPPPEILKKDIRERLGFSDFIRDQDGIVRRQLLFMNQEANSLCTTEFSFSLQLAFEYLKSQGINKFDITPSNTLKIADAVFNPLSSRSSGYQGIDANGGQVLLNWRASDRIAPAISLTEVLTGQVNPNAFKNKIVLIGVIAKGDLQDYLPTPYGRDLDTQKPGVLIHAHMLSQILSHVLDNRPLLQTWAPESEITWILGWSVVGGILVLRLCKEQTRLLITIITTTGILYILCFGLIIFNYWVPFVPSALALIVTSIVVKSTE
ncbi:MAG: CHASE2 domain-containing protein, partial [Calothrix sp. C42_A2020_038]|nr:CHASE2 domain-containing protein [Calothrix sp. C42_A2020_038]